MFFFSGINFCSAAWVGTEYATNITKTSATIVGSFHYVGYGSSYVDERGFVYGTTSLSLPTRTTVSPGGTGYDHYVGEYGDFYVDQNFSENLLNLSPSANQTTYYYRAYSHDENGYYYGLEHSFTTLKKIEAPVVYTYAATSIGSTTAIINGRTYTGGTSNDSHGFVFGTSSVNAGTGGYQGDAPEHAGYQTIARKEMGQAFLAGEFSFTVKTLLPNTKYYFRAFSQTAGGYGYGAEYSFTTTNNIPLVTTQAASNITDTSAKLNGNTDSGGSSSDEHGFLYGTTSIPITPGNVAPENVGYNFFTIIDFANFSSGPFSSTQTSLQPGTTYYYRAYSQNSIGYGYGDEFSFTTTQIGDITPPMAVTGLKVE